MMAQRDLPDAGAVKGEGLRGAHGVIVRKTRGLGKRSLLLRFTNEA